MKTTLSRFIETAFNLFDVTGDGHINAKVFILMMMMKIMVVKMMVVKVLLMKILFLGVCLCEQQATTVMIMTMMMMMIMMLKVLLIKILYLGVCLCEQQAGRQGLKPKYNNLISLTKPNQEKQNKTKIIQEKRNQTKQKENKPNKTKLNKPIYKPILCDRACLVLNLV